MSHCSGQRHCEGAVEKNVFSRESREDDVATLPTTPLAGTSSPTSAAIGVDSPTASPVMALPDCILNEDGTFGEGSEEKVVTYLYQVQTTIDETAASLDATVLGDLENSMSGFLMEELLEGSACSGSTISSRKLQSSMITGLESAPTDAVRPGLEGGTLREASY